MNKRAFLKAGAATVISAAIMQNWRTKVGEIKEIEPMDGNMLVSGLPDYVNKLVASHNELVRRLNSLNDK